MDQSEGLALVSPANEVVQLISYEGAFSASGGPAANETSDYLGVSETSTTPTGISFQLKNTGILENHFEWQGPLQASPGEINEGQRKENP
jgi:hypothetical protein